MQGIVKFFNDPRGFGFITPDGGGKDIFVHVTALKKTNTEIGEGDKVSFDTEQGKRGPQAVNVKVIPG